MTEDLQAKAREWLLAEFGSVEELDSAVEALGVLLRSVAAEARKEALEEAAKDLDPYVCPCAEIVRTLAGRKEGT